MKALKSIHYSFLFVIAFLCFGCKEQTCSKVEASPFDNKIIKDLTHEFSDETIYWVTAKEFHLDTVFAGHTDKGFYYTANNICTAEHGGTHVNAPIHFAEGKQSVDQIPLKNLIGQAIKIDVSEKTEDNPDYQVSIDDFTHWETQEGMQIPNGSIVLLQTGWGKHYPNVKQYLGTEQRGEVALKLIHFPGLSPEAAQWLVNNRNIKAIGLDTPSIDYGQSVNFESHVILLDKNIPVFENLANLNQLPSNGFNIVALPMKIKGGSGGPLRIIALLEP